MSILKPQPVPIQETSQSASEAIVEQLPIGVFRKDCAGRFTFVNLRFCQSMGWCQGKSLARRLARSPPLLNRRTRPPAVLRSASVRFIHFESPP